MIFLKNYLLLKLRAAIGKLWGASPYLMKWAYTGMVCPMVTYGCLVWSKVTNTTACKKKLERVNRLGLLSMSHFRRSTPSAGLVVLQNIISLYLHIQKEASLAMLRTKENTLYEREALTTVKSSLKDHHLKNQQRLDRLKLKGLIDEKFIHFPLWERNYRLQESSLQSGKPGRGSDIEVYRWH